MKKVILLTVVSLFVFGSMVVTPFGVALAQNCLTPGAANGPGSFNKIAAHCFQSQVKAVITISKDHKLKLYHAQNNPPTPFQKPKSMGMNVDQTTAPGPPNNRPLVNLPFFLLQDVTGDKNGKYKESTITVYGDDTCMQFNGIWYCW